MSSPEEILNQINQELADYPSPITGCDAQYNYLLEQRTMLERFIKGLDTEKFEIMSRVQDHQHQSN
jgi:hypothetical protein